MTEQDVLVLVAGASVKLTENFIPFQVSRWLREGVAAEVDTLFTAEQFNQLRDQMAKHEIDVFRINSAYRRKKLLLADMDATIVEGETLDELAAACGLKDEISAITQQAMRGEIDFKQALRARVAKLKGLPVTELRNTLDKMVLTPGARDMVRVMSHYGATCVLVSGGFTFFTNAIARQCGFQFNHGNELEISGNTLTGQVLDPILDKDAKKMFLTEYTSKLGLHAAETLAVGDGANDIPMLENAGLGVGYRPKPLVKEHVQNYMVFSDHMALLYVQGYTGAEIDAVLNSSKG